MKQKLGKLLKSQYIQIILFVILVILLIVSFVRLNDVIKLVGLPFRVLPNALGLTQSVSRNEVKNYEITANTNILVVIEQPGHYYVFTPFFYEWSLGPKIEIKTSQGSEINVEDWLSVARLYDTIYAHGAPSHRFYIDEPGSYQFYFIPKNGSLFGEYVPSSEVPFGSERTSSYSKFKISIAPDYVTKYENVYRPFYKIQGAILFVLCLIIYYLKVARGALHIRRNLKTQRLAKRNQINSFMKNNSSKE
jgi:hypothetical protein